MNDLRVSCTVLWLKYPPHLGKPRLGLISTGQADRPSLVPGPRQNLLMVSISFLQDFHTLHLSYFSVAVIQHLEQDNLQNRESIWSL